MDGSPHQRSHAMAADDEIDLVALTSEIWARKGTVLAVALATLAVGAIFAASSPPVYEATGLIQLEEKSGRLAIPESISDLTGSAPQSVTEIEILQSRMVLGKAVAESHADWRVQPRMVPLIGEIFRQYPIPLPDWDLLAPYARKGETLQLALLEVPPNWLGQPLTVVARDDNGFDLTLPDGTRVSGQVGDRLYVRKDNFALQIADLSAPAQREFRIVQIAENAAIGALRRQLTVAERGRQSGILGLQYNAGSPELAERTLAAIMRAYLDQNVTRSAAEASTGLAFIEGQLPEAERAVRDAEARLNAFREERGTINLGLEAQTLLGQVESAELRLSDLKAKEEEIAQKYTENHPTYRQLLNDRQRLQDRLAELRQEVQDLPETEREILNLTREREIAQSVYGELLSRAQELSVLKASTIGNVRVIDTAQSREIPVAPNKKRILALAGLLGILGGTGLVLLRRALRSGLRTSSELEELGLPVLATIAFSARTRRRSKDRRQRDLLALAAPDDPVVEGFRALRTRLHFALHEARNRTLVITSSVPDVGKSFTTANLAVVAAQAQKKVCLIDADMRKGRLNKIMGLDWSPRGLSDFLSGSVPLDAVIRATAIDGLSYIPPGMTPSNPSELLMGEAFAQLVAQLDEMFDLILVDTPPVLAVTDPVIMGRVAGSVMIVERYSVSRSAQVDATLHTLRSTNARIIGGVLNAFDPRKEPAGATYAYGYQYGYR